MANAKLDIATEQFLAARAALKLRPLNSMSPQEARDRLSMLVASVPPTPLYEVSTQTLSNLFAARVYRPSDDQELPVVIFYHGGGWVLCDLDSHDALARQIARQANCVVVSVDYRRAPECKFPVPLEDAYSAICWVAENATTLGLDSTRLVVAGDSAGGNLAAAVCLMARDQNGPPIFHQCLWYPVTDISNMDSPSYQAFAEGYFLKREDMRWFAAHYLASAEQAHLPYVSPLTSVNLRDLPPAHIVTAGFDVLRDEGQRYAEALSKSGVAVEYRCFHSLIHGFLTQAPVLPNANLALEEVLSSLHKILWHGRPTVAG